jgi:diguanylate cyclase (GGDEF)-like protein
MVVTISGAAGQLPAQLDRNIRFDRISLEQGLSQSAINAILQDSRGFMWIGTEDGLNRYDGYDFTIHKHDSQDPASLSHNFIWTILEDRDGDLWFGTDGGGLNRWNPHDRRFTRFRNDPADPASLSHDQVRVLYEDSHGTLWAGTDGGGLNRFDAVNQKFTRLTHDPSNPDSIGSDRIRAIHEDQSGALWIGTYGGGLDKLDRSTGNSTHFRHDENDPSSLSDDHVYTIYEDRDNTLWIGTYGGGLNRYDPRADRFVRHRHDPGDPRSLAADRVRAVYQDDQGVLWVGTDRGLNERRADGTGFIRYQNDPVDPKSLTDDKVTVIYPDRGGVIWVGTKAGGLNKWNTGTGFFSHLKVDPDTRVSLSSNMVSSIYEDGDGMLWVGTFGGGLNRVDRVAGKVTQYRHDPEDTASLSDDRVMSLLVDRAGTVWIGTYEGGLNRLDPADGRIKRFRHDPADPKSINRNGVMSLYEDRAGTLWVGTYEGGLDRFDRATENFVHYEHDPSIPTSLSNPRVTCLREDSSGILWVGTDGGGLNRFDAKTGTFSQYRHDPENPQSLPSDVVWSIFEDSRGTLWVGTQGGGLGRCERGDSESSRCTFKVYSERDGLPNDFVYGILADENDNLWLSTNKGVSKFNPRAEVFTNYDATDGLQSNEFNFGAYHRGKDGELFFGGINGLNAFYPDSIRRNRHVPPVVLTAFLKLNQHADLDRPLSELDEVLLKHKDYVVSFEFAALDFTAPQRNRYAYKLEGFDEDWIDLGALRRATYTNLDAGEYVLRVKASNNDGVWNEDGLALDIRVLPPPWKTWWAYTIYTALVLSLVVAYSRAQSRKLEREAEYSRKLERDVEARTRELAERNQDLELANRMLEDASLTDSLTGLKNRRFLMTEIDKDIALTERYYMNLDAANPKKLPAAPRFMFLMIDLDGLKGINDTYGHMAGDAALLQMRDLLLKVCRKTDTVIRWGGDEFLVVGRNMDQGRAEQLAERIRVAVAEHPFDLDIGEETRLSCSIGLAYYPFLRSAPTLISWEQVVTIADRALYLAKAGSRNAWVAILSTEKTPADDLVKLVNEQVETMFSQGTLKIRTSIPDRERRVPERV